MRREPDLVYVDDAARADALASYLHRRLLAGSAVALVVPFRGHLPRLREQLEQRGFSLVTLLGAAYRDHEGENPTIAVTAVDQLEVPRLLGPLGRIQTFVQVERHPLRAHDEAVFQALHADGKPFELAVYLSLDDGLFSIFDPDGGVKKLVRKLEVPRGEPLTHSFITSSIESAQAKVAKRVRSEVPAQTFVEWRSQNAVKA